MSAPTPSRVVLPGPIGDRPYRIVFVCTGNICRSPMAEVITRSLAESTALEDGTTLGDHLEVSSAGTGPWHEGEPMHPYAAESRSAAAATPASATSPTSSCPPSSDGSTSWSPSTAATARRCAGSAPIPTASSCSVPSTRDAGAAADVPDPYYGDQSVFDECRDMIAAACTGLVAVPGGQLGLALGGVRPPRPGILRRTKGLVSDPPARDRSQAV